MGKVLVTAKLENLTDLGNLRRGLISSEEVHTVEVHDALIDTGATGFSAPRSVIERLGLKPTWTRSARTAGGIATFQMYDGIELTIQGRKCLTDVGELPEGCPVLIGQIPLEGLDFVIDPVGRKLVGNPSHGGEHMIEMYSHSPDQPHE